jgi:FkbM family methyltransferase
MWFTRLLPPAWKERLRRRAGAVTLEGRLMNLARAGFAPRRVIDAGAFRGQWTAAVSGIFPHAEFLLIEPQPHLAGALTSFCAARPRCRYHAALLGAEPGTARFLVDETNSRIVDGSYNATPGASLVELPVSRLDAIAAATGFAACDFLKLDLQGHELAALAGAGNLFGRIEVIQVEVSWLRIGPVPLIHEVMTRFHERGYQPYDILGFNYRPRDGALWQSDLIFVHRDSNLIASRSWD